MTRLLSMVGAALAATGIAASAAVAEPCTNRGGTLVWISSQVPRHFNPAVQSGIATMSPGAQIFATPLRYDDNWQPHPYLAKSWKVSEDGLSVTLNLVENARFHDGQPVTSEDVAFSVMVVRENHPFKTMFAAVDRVDTPDPHTAIIRLTRPHPAILLAMSSALLPIIPKHIYGDGQDVKTHPRNNDPVGSGPFKFVEYKRGEFLVLEKNPDFFIKGRPCLDKIVIKIIKDASSRVIAMEQGEGDIFSYMTDSSDIRRLEKQKHLIVTPKGYAAIGPINWLAFNTKKPPLDDKRVRQAISYAIDRDFIRMALHQGVSAPATGPIAPGTPFYSADVNHYEFDLDKANQLLDESGHKRNSDGIRFALEVDHIPAAPEQQKAIAEYLRPALKKVGIEVTVRNSPDFPTWAKRVASHEFDMTMDLVFNWGDPVIGVARTYLTSNIRKGVIWSNTQSYSNPRVDDLLAKAGQEMDFDKRKALYKEFQQIVVDDAPLAFINVMPNHTAYDKNLGNPPLTIWGTVAPLDEVYWKKMPNR